MKAAYVADINRFVVKEVALPALRTGEALVKVAYGGLCGPTDDAIAAGLHPRAAFPLVLCHEFSGVVADTFAGGGSVAVGDRVVINPLMFCGHCAACLSGNSHVCAELRLVGIDCDGGFQEYAAVPIHTLVKLPEDMPLDVAALCEPVAVGIHAAREAGLRLCDSAVVFGAGPIGLFIAKACQNAGARAVTVIDRDIRRVEFARVLGFEACTGAADIAHKYDFVFDSTGAGAVLPELIRLAAVRGTIIIAGKFDESAPVDLHAVLFNELVIRGARVYRYNEFQTAISEVYKNQDYYRKFITDCFGVDEIETIFKTFRGRKNLSRIFMRFEQEGD